MPKKVTAWQCSYCTRYRKTKAIIREHEAICFHNPNRIIVLGELAVWATLPHALKEEDSYGVPMSEFHQPRTFVPDYLLAKYKWWPMDDDEFPALGFVYAEDGWIPIEGYIPPTFAPMFSWRDEYIPEQYIIESPYPHIFSRRVA